ncbi:choice-of-anchor L domain-containing protein [Flavobacterium capsici]|uniref:Choice-of-anchor L domain-containing protein n=1 Tax=Flavobacterium capsici TaxID=3075618 RepID=A0AA96EVG6_9FLAO|nr:MULTISPECIES: choice-of-anchor L domain-containing protein [unclassified Flavobacterium]WNM19323.1 choice-of-anchor L domain-containing protein [Flavobacterium sp. PMR2A8]WNM20712.1 choice-of-anchor L domain-containing protein [Flavobacterium sp. PMTSA4]
MKRKLHLLSLLFFVTIGFSQPITVNTTTYTVPQLVTDVLFGNGTAGSACVGTISNITWSTGTNFGSTNGIGFFQNTNPSFPLSNGVILSSGNVINAPGPNTTTQSNGTWPGDAQLFNYIQGLGIDPGLTSYNNATVLEFDFTPLTDQMSFDFLFASEEYGTFQCAYSDAFAFFLTDLTAATPPVNLALIPNTNTPISVVTIRDNTNNASCGSANPSYFNNFNGGVNAAAAATNFNGETVLMTANSAVIPGHTYHIRLVIADRNDSLLDSAVFLGGGSFNIGTPELAGIGYESFPDLTIADGTALCGSTELTIQAGAIAIPGVTYEWTFNTGIIPNATSNSYNVTQSGVYGITITYPGGCSQTDSMTVEFYDPLPIGTPNDLTQCESPFDLTQNQSIILNGQSYPISYYHSLADAEVLSNPITNLSNYPGVDGEQIFVAVEDDLNTGCITTTSFYLYINDSGCATPIPPPDLTLCENSIGSGNATFDFTPQIPIILGTNSASDYTISFHTSQTGADNNTGIISPFNAYLGTDGQIIYIRFVDNSSGGSNTTAFFTLHVNPLPSATISGATSICSGQTATISFTGTPNAVINFSAGSVTLDAAGTGSYTTPALTATTNYSLIDVTNPTTGCSSAYTDSVTVTVLPLPTATISGTTAVCVGDPSPSITFTGANSTAPYTFNYTLNTVAQTPVTTAAGSTYTLPVSTATAGTFTYELVNVSSSTTPSCSQNQTGTATVTVNPLPTAAISGTTTICSGNTATITFTGTPNAIVTYNTVGPPSPITLDATGNATLTTPVLTSSVAYNLISVTNPTTNCTQLVGGSAVVTVVPLPTATISGTTTVCQGAVSPNITFTGANGTAPYTFTYTDPAGATQTITTTAGNSITLPVSTATPGIYPYQLVSVSSSTTPACSQPQTGTATVTVNPMPTATIAGTQAVCLNSTPDPQIVFTGANGVQPYTFTYLDENGTTQTIQSTGGNTAVINVPTTTAGIFNYNLVSVSSASTPACAQPQSGSATVTVNTAPVINTPTAYEVCDDNNDGFSCLFDLTTKNAEISTDPNVVITYHETSTDATTGANPITTSTYCNIDPGTQTLYVRAYFVGTSMCYSTTTLQLIVHPRPLPNPVITDYELCDYNNPGDGVEVFTLNTKTVEIANGQTGVTVTYYLTQADAIAQTNPLPNSYTNTSSPQQIWINISNNTTGCNSVASFNLVVNPLPATAVPLPIFECSNGAVTTATFDLTVNEGVTTAGATGVIVTYYNTFADANAQPPTNAIATPTTYLGNDNETVYIRVEYTATGCYSITTQLLRVTQGPVAITPQPLQYCDPNNDGFGTFDLDSTINEIAGGSLPAGVTVSFHETPTDALLGANPLVSPYANIDPWTQTIYVKVFYTTTGCSNYVELQLIVNPTPEATEPDDLHLCDYTGAVGYEPFNLTLVIPQVLGSIDPSTHTVTFYTSLADAQTPSNAITNVASYINSVIDQQTIYVRVETTATGCFDIVDFDIIVDPLPNSTQPNYPQYSLCDNDQSLIGYEVFDLQSQVANILLGQTGMSVHFYPSLTDAQNDTNEITNLSYQNAIIYVQTLGIRITNDATGCYVISTMDIRVEPLPTPIPPTQPYTVCDDDQDGFAQFDLNTLTTDILQGANYTLTFHETLTNAQTGDNPLPMLYTNINPFVQIIYVRAEDPTTGCIGITTVELNVNPSPEAITGLPNIEICDTDSNTQNGQTIVNLAQQTPLVLAQQPLPASAYTVTYYTSQTLAEQGSLPIMNVTNYTNTTNPQTIWVRVENIASKCYNIGSFQIIVGTPLVVATPQPINECDDDANPNDQHTNFDLTVRQITALPGYTINYYPSLAEAQTGTNQITTPTNYINVPAAVQTLGVEIISPQGCKSYTTLNIRVLPIPTPRTNPATLAAVCENATGSGQATVDLTATAAYIANGDPNVALHYFYTQSDLENNVNEILTPTAALVGDPSIAGTTINQVQYIYIAVSSTQNFDYTSRPCYKMVEQGFIINPLPVVDIVGTNNEYQVCEDDASGVNDGFEVFDLTSQVADLLEGNTTTPTSNYSVAFYLDAAATTPVPNPSAYTNISNPQPIYVVITNTTTGCTSDIGTFNILVNPKPIVATLLDDFESCDTDGVNDGMMFYDNNPLGLGDYIDDILGATQAPADYMVEFYLSQADAEAGISANAIQNLSTYQVQTGTYWIRVTNNATGCYILDDFNVVIEQLAEPLITTNTGSAIACVDWNTTAVNNNLILDSNVANAANYTFEWYADGVLLSETGPTLAVTDISVDQVVYSVIATSITPANLGCASEEVFFTVVRSGPAANLTYTVTNAFSDTQIITVTNDGYGIYHYSLDDGPILDNGGIFTDVTLGEHTVYVWDVRDVNGYSCGVQSISGVQIIDYPHYFTPNGDGFNDTWNIVGLSSQVNAKIYIFDRYGKLLKQISSTSAGWDGTYNGALLPSDDYWFTVDFIEQNTTKQFRAHFALKR